MLRSVSALLSKYKLRKEGKLNSSKGTVFRPLSDKSISSRSVRGSNVPSSILNITLSKSFKTLSFVYLLNECAFSSLIRFSARFITCRKTNLSYTYNNLQEEVINKYLNRLDQVLWDDTVIQSIAVDNGFRRLSASCYHLNDG